MAQQLTSSPHKKLLDEGSFQELLAAAYVLQQHSERSDDPSTGSLETLSEIVRIQRSIRSGKFSLVEMANFISQQLQKFTGADGVALGIVSDQELVYLAAIGSASPDLGRRVARDSSLAAKCILTGITFQSASSQDDPNVNHPPADVKSLIAVPVEYENRVVAVLEARFATVNGFKTEEVHTCELMAPLVREVIVRAGRRGANKEKRKVEEQQNTLFPEPVQAAENKTATPQTSAEVRQTPVVVPQSALSIPPQFEPSKEEPEAIVRSETKLHTEVELAPPDLCRGCGEHLGDDEAFCGKCGTERSINPEGPLQSKWASLWYMNEARRSRKEDEPSEDILPAKRLEPAVLDTDEPNELAGEENTTLALSKPSLSVEWLPEVALSPRRAWLQHQWRVNRANFCLAGASILLVAALLSPAIEPKTTANSSVPRLTLFERILVGLGIAEAPQATVSSGNPDIPVWVDLHTALYYCPGSDLYGKTEGGKIATQRSAQLDQFEPAHRKACN